MNYLTVNPPPLQGDEDASTSAGLNFPFGIPFTNQSAFQSAFTPEGFSFESPFGMSSNSFNNTSYNGNAVAGPSSRPKPFPENSVSGNPQPHHLNGLSEIMPSGVFDNLGNTASSVSLVTGDRFSQLLETKLGLDLAYNAHNNNPSTLPTQPFPSVSNNLDPFDHQAVEQALKDYAQIQVPPDFVAPAVPDAYLQAGIVKQQFPFSPLTGAPNPNIYPNAQTSGNSSLLAPSTNFFQQPLYGNPATFQTPIHSSSTTPRHSPNHRPNPITPFELPMVGNQETLPPPLRIHVQQTPAMAQQHGNPFGSADVADGSWAMELLKGYKSAQSRLNLPSWNSLVGANSVLPAQSFLGEPNVQPKTSISSNGVASVSGSMSSGPLVETPNTSEPVGNPRKRSSTKIVKDATPESSDSEYEERPKKKKPTIQRTTTSQEKDGTEKKPVIACHICRARKLKCNGGKPKCSNCIRRNEESCVYDTVLRRRGPGRNNKKDRRPRNGRPKGGATAARTKLDSRQSQSPATESTDGTTFHGSQRAVSMGKGSDDPVMGMGWDQVLIPNMVR